MRSSARPTRHVSGSVKVKLFKGQATALCAESPWSLYSEDLATFGPSASYEHADSYGFVRLYGLPGMIAGQVRRAGGKHARASRGAAATGARKARGARRGSKVLA
jgi:argininosuccinate synthase